MKQNVISVDVDRLRRSAGYRQELVFLLKQNGLEIGPVELQRFLGRSGVGSEVLVAIEYGMMSLLKTHDLGDHESIRRRDEARRLREELHGQRARRDRERKVEEILRAKAKQAQQAQQAQQIKVRIHRPPGVALESVVKLFSSKKTFTRRLQPVIEDMRTEYIEALALAGAPKARWVVLRGYWAVFRGITKHWWHYLLDVLIRTARSAISG